MIVTSRLEIFAILVLKVAMNAIVSLLRKRIVQCGAVVVVIATLLILTAPIIAEPAFALLFILLLIPTAVPLGLTFIVAGLALFSFRQNRVAIGVSISLLMSQALILTAWLLGLTAESAFDRHSPLGHPILDPQVEWVLMKIFWIGAALVLLSAIIGLAKNRLSREFCLPTNTRRILVLLLLLEGFIVVTLTVSSVNYRRSFYRSSVSSVSPGANREIRLVPMNAGFDVNGVVISRRPGALVWRTVGEVGDLLSESDGERFVWADNDSKAYLVFQLRENEVPVFGFDFAKNQSVDSKSYREPLKSVEPTPSK